MTGEKFVCKKCNGSGKINHEPDIYVSTICGVCDGSGYVDWVEYITGRNRRNLERMADDFKNFHDEYITKMTDNIAKSIDEEILKSLSGASGDNNGRREVYMQKVSRDGLTKGWPVRKMQGVWPFRLDRQHHRKK